DLPGRLGLVFLDVDQLAYLDGAREFHARTNVARLPADGLELHFRDTGKSGRGDWPNGVCPVRPHGFPRIGLQQWLFPARPLDPLVHLHQESLRRNHMGAVRQTSSNLTSGLWRISPPPTPTCS